MQHSHSDSYASAGVDVNAGYESVRLIGPHIKSTARQGVIGGFGGFGGFFELPVSGMKRPVTVSGTDGVGTKLKIAFLLDKHDTIGIDCVAMCVNDIVCSGAEPLYFLDYIAMGKNVPARTERIVAGVAEGCRDAGCALIGGETAEHPGLMPENEYDIAGFSVGLVEYDDIIDGSCVTHGDVLIGLESSGLHSNGFSLVRKVLSCDLTSLDTYAPDLGSTLGEELLRPTKIYVKPLLSTIRKFGKSSIHGIANITGGGFYENVPRMLPDGICANIDTSKFPKKPIFAMLAKKGAIPERDMYNTFNMGIGLVMAVAETQADAVTNTLNTLGTKAVQIGVCKKDGGKVVLTW